ncbi:MAG: AMP-binding protein [Polyangiaceae bacterium]|nr:AMP-binding protein [Polyangiaceae bacterium]
MSLSIFDAARDAPREPALITPERSFTFGELADLAARVETPSTLLGHLDVNTIVQLHACIAKRRPVVLVHPRWTARERLAARGRAPEDALAVVFTSGSSGAPRGVVLPRRAFEASARASAKNLGWQDDDRWLLELSPAHVGGLSILTRCLMDRKAVVLGSDLERSRATLVSWVPTQLARWLDAHPEQRAPQHLRAVVLGGAAASPALRRRARARGFRVLGSYGLTEACSQVSTEREPGDSSGAPLPGISVRLEDGCIQIAGPTLLSRYWDGECPLSEDGWLTTRDVGRFDTEGRLHVLGRVDDVIVTGGENVHPLEVEAVLESDPRVREACVFGIDDATWGQRVAAALVLTEAADANGVVAAADLADFKRPRELFVVSNLARTASGKLDRRAQRKSCTAQTSPPAVT